MFYETFCGLCEKHNLTPSGAAAKIGFNRASVTMWKNTGKAPKQELLVKIADYFDVTTDYLLGKNEIDEYSQRFRHNLSGCLEQLRDNLVGDEPAMADYYELLAFTEKTHPLSLAEACQAADLIGESVGYLLQEDNTAEACSADETKKAPGMDKTTPGDDLDQELMNLLGKLTVEQKYLLLALLNSTILQNPETLSSDQKVAGDKAQ